MITKITETPEFEYKGVIYSDGVTNKSFNIVPKATGMANNGSS